MNRTERIKPLNTLPRDLRFKLATLLKRHKCVYKFPDGYAVSQMIYGDELCFAILNELADRGKELELRTLNLGGIRTWTAVIYGRKLIMARGDTALLAVARAAEIFIDNGGAR